MAENKNLHSAKNAKKDEFYTQLSDIENELKHYEKHFEGKTVLCNCDDPRVSNFFHYFAYNFARLKLKRLITTCYKNQNMDLFSENKSEKAIYLIYDGDKQGNPVPSVEDIGINYLQGDGDFRSKECIELLKQADIVVTNPPFSLFREYVAQLVQYEKKFLILGNVNAIKYKEIFPLIIEKKLWWGITTNGSNRWMRVPDYYVKTNSMKIKDGVKYCFVNGIMWYTNLDCKKRHEPLELWKRYSPEEYPKYDNYEAIDVNKVSDIPMDYDGIMGVPITFFNHYCPEQFELIGVANHGCDNKYDLFAPTLNGAKLYTRILIKRKR